MKIYQVSWEHCLRDCHLAHIRFRYNCDQLNEKAPIDLSVEVLRLRARKAEKGAVFSRVVGDGNYKEQTWICSISSGANSFCPSTPQNSFRSAPVLPSMSRSVKKSHSCSTPKIRCFNCVNNGYGSKKFMINLISIICLYLKFHHVVSFLLFRKII